MEETEEETAIFVLSAVRPEEAVPYSGKRGVRSRAAWKTNLGHKPSCSNMLSEDRKFHNMESHNEIDWEGLRAKSLLPGGFGAERVNIW